MLYTTSLDKMANGITISVANLFTSLIVIPFFNRKQTC